MLQLKLKREKKDRKDYNKPLIKLLDMTLMNQNKMFMQDFYE